MAARLWETSLICDFLHLEERKEEGILVVSNQYMMRAFECLPKVRRKNATNAFEKRFVRLNVYEKNHDDRFLDGCLAKSYFQNLSLSICTEEVRLAASNLLVKTHWLGPTSDRAGGIAVFLRLPTSLVLSWQYQRWIPAPREHSSTRL